MVRIVVEQLFDLVVDCEDRRVKWWAFVAAVLLVGGNIAFFFMAAAVLDGRALAAVAAFGASSALLLASGLCLVRMLWVLEYPPGQQPPPHWKWWALLFLGVIVAVPAPLVLVAAVFGFIYLRRHKRSASVINAIVDYDKVRTLRSGASSR